MPPVLSINSLSVTSNSMFLLSFFALFIFNILISYSFFVKPSKTVIILASFTFISVTSATSYNFSVFISLVYFPKIPLSVFSFILP